MILLMNDFRQQDTFVTTLYYMEMNVLVKQIN